VFMFVVSFSFSQYFVHYCFTVNFVELIVFPVYYDYEAACVVYHI